MEFDHLADYTREQGARILYERLGAEVTRKISGGCDLGERECIIFYSSIIRGLIQERKITERNGRFSGGNLSLFIQHANSHAAVSEIARKYDDTERARRLCRKDPLNKFIRKYGRYLWIPLERREEFERELDVAYSKRR